MNDTRLYILMRTDRKDMNAGKAVAQGSHAANQCIFEARAKAAEGDTVLEAQINEWENQSGFGFGTCIVLGVNEAEMRKTVRLAQLAGFHAGITHDPSYPTGMPRKKISDFWMASFVMMLLAVVALAFNFGILALALASLATFSWVYELSLSARPKPPFVIPLDTCGYVFGGSADLKWVVGHLPLMR